MESARNVELKARLHDLAAARQTAQRWATNYLGIERQVDTYFHCRHGRLKLREINDAAAQLVAYVRPNQADAKCSSYVLVDVPDAALLKQALATTMGVQVVVSKRREIFLRHNVRIHLDDVEGLGKFLELEAVLGPTVNEAAGHAQVAELQTAFAIAPADLLAVSYADLLLAQASA